MATITKENINQIIVRMTYNSPQNISALTKDADITSRRLKALSMLKEDLSLDRDLDLLDLVGSWYSFCDESLDNEYYETVSLTSSLGILEHPHLILSCRKFSAINVTDAIITESKNPFTKKELKMILFYFNDKITNQKEQSKAELYTKIKEQWLHFYLNQEA